jgi:hypothetical protein
MNKQVSFIPSTDHTKFSHKRCNKCINKLINISSRSLLSLIQSSLLSTTGEHQQQFLHHVLKKSQATVFGQTYHFSEIQGYQEFQQQIPLSQYEEFFDRWIVPQLK